MDIFLFNLMMIADPNNMEMEAYSNQIYFYILSNLYKINLFIKFWLMIDYVINH